MHNEKEEQDDAAKKKIMDYLEQQDAFSIELENLVERFRSEFDLTPETLAGCLLVQQNILTDPVILDLGSEMLEEDENEQE